MEDLMTEALEVLELATLVDEEEFAHRRQEFLERRAALMSEFAAVSPDDPETAAFAARCLKEFDAGAAS
ncbi:hypothetical protein ACFQ8W_00575 [Streptomyces sp. NPDC056508]|uniref:hypothetical protein n=1 Tax=Streptomyces sp. NPDC056508 TaxID=3345845 RepID=UPI0036BE3125